MGLSLAPAVAGSSISRASGAVTGTRIQCCTVANTSAQDIQDAVTGPPVQAAHKEVSVLHPGSHSICKRMTLKEVSGALRTAGRPSVQHGHCRTVGGRVRPP